MTHEEQQMMPSIAHRALAVHFEGGRAWEPNLAEFPEALREMRASFVTLQLHGNLRGCIGTLHACLPLVQDIAVHAVAAAIEDPRFHPLTEEEFQCCDIHVSALQPPIPFPVPSREDLILQLRPGLDGLILSQPGTPHHATFLPCVWEQLPEADIFLEHLFLKAGLPETFWDETLYFERYEVEEA